MFRLFRVWLTQKSLDELSRGKITFLERLTDTKIGRPHLFLRAVRHRSKLIEGKMAHSESYEQLEFLGDAVLDLIVTEIIFTRYPGKNEGFMTQTRSRIVKGETLAGFALQMGIPEVIEVGDRVKDQGIEFSGSVLSDIFEAIVGAVYRDSGYEAAYRFVQKAVDNFVDFDHLEHAQDNYKSVLLELAQSKKLAAPTYKVVDLSGPDHNRTFKIQVLIGEKVYGQGIGKNKKKAEQLAASEALKSLSEGASKS